MSDQKKPLERPVYAGDAAVTLLGGGALGADDLRDVLPIAPVVVAADGGADAALKAGLTPRAVVGDFDSISEQTKAVLPESALHIVTEQDSTDFDKALRRLVTPLTLAVGFTGARIDHQLAAFHTLVARPECRCIVVGEQDIVFNAPPRVEFRLETGARVSLFPMDEVSGRSQGLRWPIDGLVFHPARKIGTSNAALGGGVIIEADAPGLLVMLPRAALPVAAQALMSAETPRWDV